MSWERDPLLAKARLFFSWALEQPREDPRFGLWCSLSLELLARAAVADISPALLAEPDRDQRHLLYALGRGDPRAARSIGATQVIQLCVHLLKDFTSEHAGSARAIFSQRNMELHTGAAAFSEYDTQQWIEGFYGCCAVLCPALGETLESLLGNEEAAVARQVLSEAEGEVRQSASKKIVEHRRAFGDRDADTQSHLANAAVEEVKRLVRDRHHKVTCPACGSAATVQGDPFGEATVSHDEDQAEIVVRQAVAPKRFACSACELRLEGFGELRAAGLGSQYTRTTRYTPEEYFDLIDPSDTGLIQDLFEQHIANFGSEYDNE